MARCVADEWAPRPVAVEVEPANRVSSSGKRREWFRKLLEGDRRIGCDADGVPEQKAI